MGDRHLIKIVRPAAIHPCNILDLEMMYFAVG